MKHSDAIDPRHPCSRGKVSRHDAWQMRWMSAHLPCCRGSASQRTRYSCLVKRRGVSGVEMHVSIGFPPTRLETSRSSASSPRARNQEQMFRLGVWPDFHSSNHAFLSIIRDEQATVCAAVIMLIARSAAGGSPRHVRSWMMAAEVGCEE
jgi:hypothetical protein